MGFSVEGVELGRDVGFWADVEWGRGSFGICVGGEGGGGLMVVAVVVVVGVGGTWA